MPAELTEPVYDVLVAQAMNIARIDTGLIPSVTNDDDVELWGPAPNVVRLYDEPLELVKQFRLEKWERIISVMPVGTGPEAAIIQREDRNFTYQVQFLVKLLPSEMSADRAATVAAAQSAAFRGSNPLAVKMHKLLSDFHKVFIDNRDLVTDACPNGLLNHHRYELVWDDAAVYPEALCHAIIEAQVNAWG